MGIKAWQRWQVSQIHVRSVTGEEDTTLVRLTLSETTAKLYSKKSELTWNFQKMSRRGQYKKGRVQNA